MFPVTTHLLAFATPASPEQVWTALTASCPGAGFLPAVSIDSEWVAGSTVVLTAGATAVAHGENIDYSQMGATTLVVHGSEDVNPGFSRRPSFRADAFTHSPGGNKTLLTLTGAKHLFGGIAGWDVGMSADDEHPDRVAALRALLLPISARSSIRAIPPGTRLKPRSAPRRRPLAPSNRGNGSVGGGLTMSQRRRHRETSGLGDGCAAAILTSRDGRLRGVATARRTFEAMALDLAALAPVRAFAAALAGGVRPARSPRCTSWWPPSSRHLIAIPAGQGQVEPAWLPPGR